MSLTATPSRAEIWLAEFDPTCGREQRGTRPALVLSADKFNRSRAELVIVLPITKIAKGIASHVPIASSDSGLDHDSFAICEQVRSVSIVRLVRRIGQAPPSTMERVSHVMRVVMEL